MRERKTGKDGAPGFDRGFRTPLTVPAPSADTGQENPMPGDVSGPFGGMGAPDPIGYFPKSPTKGRKPTIYGR